MQGPPHISGVALPFPALGPIYTVLNITQMHLANGNALVRSAINNLHASILVLWAAHSN